jgi:hypothetical protein
MIIALLGINEEVLWQWYGVFQSVRLTLRMLGSMEEQHTGKEDESQDLNKIVYHLCDIS